ncbi:MAG: STAS domain-containing protein [Clostridiales Family XIII bacterium]|jgi:anti-sigma B factor antagonist|nr:STAS domain-containing protein [Clostridiales Family XIII bacterium]
MVINKQLDGTELTINLVGRLDTITSPELEAELRSSLTDVTKLHFDLGELDYISSAGLRVILAAQKQMNKQGTMTLGNVGSVIMEVFDMTGFSDILTIV